MSSAHLICHCLDWGCLQCDGHSFLTCMLLALACKDWESQERPTSQKPSKTLFLTSHWEEYWIFGDYVSTKRVLSISCCLAENVLTWCITEKKTAYVIDRHRGWSALHYLTCLCSLCTWYKCPCLNHKLHSMENFPPCSGVPNAPYWFTDNGFWRLIGLKEIEDLIKMEYICVN